MDAMGRMEASVIDNTLAIRRSMVCEWYVVFDCFAMVSKRNTSGSVGDGVFGHGQAVAVETVADPGASIRCMPILSALFASSETHLDKLKVTSYRKSKSDGFVVPMD